MPRRPPRHPDHLARRDREDVATCQAIIAILEKLHSRGYLSDVPVASLSRWLERRTITFCSARAAGIADDDEPPRFNPS
jgi:hypothetical protein